MKTKKPQIIYAFIDSQNLGIRDQGWKLDFMRFRIYLKDKYRIQKAFLFVGYVPGNKELYSYLEKSGYILIFKPTIKDTDGKVKGNIDTELVLWAVRIEYDNYDKAVIVSGDGDFYCLIKFLHEQKKLQNVIIPNYKKYSKLLLPFKEYLRFTNDLQHKLKQR